MYSLEEIDRAYRRSRIFRDEVRRRAETVTTGEAQTITRGYLANPQLNPEVLLSIAAGGGDETLAALAGNEVANVLANKGVAAPTNANMEEPDGPGLLERVSGMLGYVGETIGEAVSENPVTDWLQAGAEDIGFDNVVGFAQRWARDPLHRANRAAARAAFTGFASIPQLAENTYRTTAVGMPGYGGPNSLTQNIKDEGWIAGVGETFLNAFQATEAGAAVTQLVETGELDQGEGFFQAGSAAELSGQLQRRVRGEVQGRGRTMPWSIGLNAANSLVDTKLIKRDSWAFDVVSGGIDATFEIVTDPIGRGARATRVLPGLDSVKSARIYKYGRYKKLADQATAAGDMVQARKYRQQQYRSVGVARKLLDDTAELDDYEVSVRALLLDDAGVIEDGGRRAVVIPQFAKYLSSGKGRRLVESMVDETEVDEIMVRHRFKIGIDAARQIAAADNADDVIRAYASGMAPDAELAKTVRMLPHVFVAPVDNMGGWMKKNISSRTKLGVYLPVNGAQLDASEPLKLLETVDKLYRLFPLGVLDETSKGRYSTTLRKQRLNDVMDALDSGDLTELWNAYDRMAMDFEEMFLKLGYDSKRARSLTTMREDRARIGQWTVDSLQDGVNADNGAILLYNQLFNGTAAIVNPADFQKIYRSMGKGKEFLRKNRFLSRYGGLVSDKSALVDDIADLEDAVRRSAGDPTAQAEASRQLRMKKTELDIVERRIDELPRKSDDIVALTVMNGFTSMMDYVFAGVWKPITLIRLAYISRVVPEELARVWMGGAFDGNRAGVDIMATAMNRSFTEDALGQAFEGAARTVDEIATELGDLTDDLRRAVADGTDQPLIQRLTTEKADLELRLADAQDSVVNAENDFFSQALIGKDRHKAMATLTRDSNTTVVQSSISMVSRTNARGNTKEKANWVQGVMERISRTASDPVASTVVRGPSDDVSVTIGNVTDSIRNHIAAGRVDPDVDRSVLWLEFGGGREYWNAIYQANASRGVVLDAQSYITMLRDDIGKLAGGTWDGTRYIDADMRIIDAIGSGLVDGRKLRVLDRTSGNQRYTREFQDMVEEYFDHPTAVDRIHYSETVPSSGLKQTWLQKAGGVFFGSLYGLTSDKLSRSPTFRSMYWKQMELLLPNMTAAEAAKLVAQAETANVSKSLMVRLRGAADLADGTATIRDADNIAKAGALRYTQDLLFDASKRGSTMEALRFVLPFGDAWKEVYTTWMKIMVEQRGMPAKRLLKGIEGGKDATLFGPGDIYGVDEDGNYTTMPDGRREGMFWSRPADGELMATFPFSQEISGVVSGGRVNMALDFPVENLNIAGSVVPGVGPAVAQFTNTLIPDDPSYDWLRKVAFPFGEPADPSSPGATSVTDVFVPGWLRRVSAVLPDEGALGELRNWLNDTRTDPSYLSTRNWVYKSLAATGQYGTDYGSQERLQREADQVTDTMYALRGLAAFTGPSAPLTRFMVETNEGNVVASLLTDEWRNLEDEYLKQGKDPDTALFDILDIYGPQLWMSTSSNTVSEIKGLGASELFFDAYRRNEEAVNTYKEVGAYFLPDDGVFSPDVYFAQARQGLRNPATPDEMYEQAGLTLAYAAYNRVRDELGPEAQRTLQDRQVLAALRRNLENHFNVSMRGGRAQDERRQQLGALESIVADAQRGNDAAMTLLGTSTGQLVIQYMAAREEAQRISVEELGLTDVSGWATSSRGRVLRDSMRQLGAELSAKDASFSRLFQFVLGNEMMDDEELVEEPSDGVASRVSKPKKRKGRR
jgi:hypothetical protein